MKQALHDFIDSLDAKGAKWLHSLISMFYHPDAVTSKVPPPPGGNDPDADGDNDIAHPDETGE